jgi:hypothetical protein
MVEARRTTIKMSRCLVAFVVGRSYAAPVGQKGNHKGSNFLQFSGPATTNPRLPYHPDHSNAPGQSKSGSNLPWITTYLVGRTYSTVTCSTVTGNTALFCPPHDLQQAGELTTCSFSLLTFASSSARPRPKITLRRPLSITAPRLKMSITVRGVWQLPVRV